jgi:dephospho-CoA kinase
VLRCGLTGGIGSGKTTVAAGLAGRGAVVIDADRIAREVVAPGSPGLAAIRDRFGDTVLAGDGTLDRAGLARLVFTDPAARADLEAITHPLIAAEMQRRAAAHESCDEVVVFDIPLLDRRGVLAYDLAAVIVVDLPEESAVARLVAGRGFSEADARARVAAQAGRAQRRRLADLVIDNSGDRAHLDAEIDRAWRWLDGLRRGVAPGQ